MKTKIISLILAVIMLLSFVSCGTETPKASSEDEEPETCLEDKEEKTAIAFTEEIEYFLFSMDMGDYIEVFRSREELETFCDENIKPYQFADFMDCILAYDAEYFEDNILILVNTYLGSTSIGTEITGIDRITNEDTVYYEVNLAHIYPSDVMVDEASFLCYFITPQNCMDMTNENVFLEKIDLKE